MLRHVVLTALALVPQDSAPDLRNAPSAAPWTEVEVYRDLVFLPVKINGKEVLACLDSGAAITCVNSRLVSELGLSDGQLVAVEGVGGSGSAELHQGLTLEVATRRLENRTILAIDLDETEEQLGRRVSLILGQDLFDDAVIDIDYPNRRVALRDPEQFEYDGPGEELALLPTPAGLLAISLGLEEHDSAPFMIDTGLVGTLAIHAGHPERDDLLTSRERMSTKLIGGVGGMRTADIATLEFVSLGAFGMQDVPVVFDRSEEASGVAGVIGGEMLGRFRLIFCKGRRLLFAESSATRISAPFLKDTIGLQTAWSEEGMRVVHVSPGSPAAASGWESGRVIVAIDGIALAPDDPGPFVDWECVLPGKSISLVDDQGRKQVLTAAEYF